MNQSTPASVVLSHRLLAMLLTTAAVLATVVITSHLLERRPTQSQLLQQRATAHTEATEIARRLQTLLDSHRVFATIDVADLSEPLLQYLGEPPLEPALLDPWGNPYIVVKRGFPQYAVLSLGPDHLVGGSGVNADIEVSGPLPFDGG